MKMRRMRVLALLLSTALLAVPVAGCGGDDDEGATPPPAAESQPAETATTETATTETGTGETGTGGGGDSAARELFASQTSPACGSCHTLADAGTTGTVGPNLDQVRPDAGTVERALQTGPGIMPQFTDQLDDEQVKQLAEYVSSVAGR